VSDLLRGRRVLLPVHHFPPRYYAGAENYTLGLAKMLLAHGAQAEVVSIEAIDAGSITQVQAERDEFDGVPVVRLRYNQMASGNRRLWDFDNPLLGDWFDDSLRTNRPDLIHFQAGYLLGVAPVFAARALGIPTLLTLHDFWYICPQHTLLRGDGSLCTDVPADPRVCVWCRSMQERLPHLAQTASPALASRLGPLAVSPADERLMRLRRERTATALASIDRVLALSEFVADKVRGIIPAARIELCRPGPRDEQAVAPLRLRTDTALRFGFLGQLAPHKGVHLLIEAYRRLRSMGQALELHLYGGPLDSPYARSLKKQAAGDRSIVFHGAIQHADVPQEMAELDLLVVASTWYENAPLVVNEALGVGTPVAVANHGGMREMIVDGVNGLLYEPRSVGALATALQALVSEPARLAQLREGARTSRVRTRQAEFGDLLGIYGELLDDYARASGVSGRASAAQES
jgi:glycosyltransferase involved in cell wall biosynthesis